MKDAGAQRRRAHTAEVRRAARDDFLPERDAQIIQATKKVFKQDENRHWSTDTIETIRAKDVAGLFPQVNQRAVPELGVDEKTKAEWARYGLDPEGQWRGLVGQVLLGKDIKRFCSHPGTLELGGGRKLQS